MSEGKIVGIGLPKTGTNSLHWALRRLGYQSVHYRHDSGLLAGQIATLEDLEIMDAISDLPGPAYYQEIDQRYPGSKFIYTVRELESWVGSLCRAEYYVEFWRKSKSEPYAINPPEDDTRQGFRSKCFNKLWPNIPRYFERGYFLQRYVQHDLEVFSYFQNRLENVLVLNICGGEGWRQLCSFLNKPIPRREPFPRREVSGLVRQPIKGLFHVADYRHIKLYGQGQLRRLSQLKKTPKEGS